MLHFTAMMLSLVVLAGVNRSWTPHTLWVQWAALAWLVVFCVHLLHFNRGTMATMGRLRR